jgi:hypothetical protein
MVLAYLSDLLDIPEDCLWIAFLAFEIVVIVYSDRKLKKRKAQRQLKKLNRIRTEEMLIWVSDRLISLEFLEYHLDNERVPFHDPLLEIRNRNEQYERELEETRDRNARFRERMDELDRNMQAQIKVLRELEEQVRNLNTSIDEEKR